MATKAEMRVEIETLAEAQGVEITTDLDRMNWPDMVSLLEAFRAQVPSDASDGVEATEETAAGEELAAESPEPNHDSPLTAPPTPTTNGADDKSLGGPPSKDSVKYRWPYTVAQGCTVTTAKRGTRGAFDRVRASDFAGGQAQLDELVASGHVAKKP